MKVVILAGGKGSRFSGLTESAPKPLISVNGKPIITRIIEHYSHYGFKDFVIPVGYKGEMIKNYFKNFDLNNSSAWDFSCCSNDFQNVTITISPRSCLAFSIFSNEPSPEINPEFS